MTGAEMQRNKEAVAAKMREKQAAGTPDASKRTHNLATTFTTN